MGLFSRSNKDKDKKGTNSNKVTIDLEKIKKNKNRDYTYNFIYEPPNKKWSIHTYVTINNFGVFIDDMLSDPSFREDWDAIKERFGKKVDEQELLKVFKFYIFNSYLLGSLYEAMNSIRSNLKSSGDYSTYIMEFDGKLDELTFKYLLTKIGEYYDEKFVKKYGQNKEQKDEQPK
jgi:hypothetical protein